MEKLEKAKSLLSHKLACSDDYSIAQLIEIMCDLAIKQKEPRQTEQRTVSSTPKNNDRPRYIPSVVKKEVWTRDEGKCSYPNCRSTHLLQYDHIQPFSLGGTTKAQNLRLLCFNHHQLVTQQTSGIVRFKPENC